MRKSKYLVLSGLYFKFNDNLTEINKVKKSFNTQNILDLLRYNDLSINSLLFSYNDFNHNFIFYPDEIKEISNVLTSDYLKYINLSNCTKLQKIYTLSFSECKLKIADLSNNIVLKEIDSDVFSSNQLKYIKFPNDITIIPTNFARFNDLQYLDLSKYTLLTDTGYGSFSFNKIELLKLPQSIIIIDRVSFLNNKIKYLDLSNCDKLERINKSAFENNNIISLKLPSNIKIIENESFKNNKIKYLDLSNCYNVSIYDIAFVENPLKEIKIQNQISITYNKYYTDDLWNQFVKYYNISKKRSGNYKYENDQWKWYPL